MQLSEHFTLSEFTRSNTAQQNGIDNTPSSEAIANLTQLCVEVLEPLRRYVEAPVAISSGYRCPRLNKLVGGVRNSQHMTGEAADIAMPTHDAEGNPLSRSSALAILREWMRWIIDNTNFDQCIMEHRSTSSHKKDKQSAVSWIHVSCRHDATKNRHCVISNIWKP